MNNKASKRLLAASVASLMLVVAFCGFTYASDDADATEYGTESYPYVKNVVVAIESGNLHNDHIYTFNVVTTQDITLSGTGIVHTGSWKFKLNDESISNDDSNPSDTNNPRGSSDVSYFGLSIVPDNNKHEFTIEGQKIGTDAVDIYYELSTRVDSSDPIVQKLHYRINVTVVEALPGSGETSLTGFVGAGLVKKVTLEDGIDKWLNFDPEGLKFYAEGLPNGLSMDIDGTISGVPTGVSTGDAKVSVYNETSKVSTYTIHWNIISNVANITDLDVTGDDLVKVADGRYLVKEGTDITIVGTVTGNISGTLRIADDDPYSFNGGSDYTGSDPGDFSSKIIEISGTGEKKIKITYTCDLDGSSGTFNVVLEQYITVVSVDVVDDATTGIGIASGVVTFAQPSQP